MIGRRTAMTLLFGSALIGACSSEPSVANGDEKAKSPTPTVTQSIELSWANAYETIGEMTAHSDAVVTGAVTASSPTVAAPGAPATDYRFTVDEWVTATDEVAEVPTISLHQTGGTIDGVTWQNDGDPLFVVGEKDLLFVRQYAPGKFLVMGGPTGRVQVVDGSPTRLPQTALKGALPRSMDELVSSIRSAAETTSH